MAEIEPKFIQLIAKGDNIYALDNSGGVWVYSYILIPNAWIQLSTERKKYI